MRPAALSFGMQRQQARCGLVRMQGSGKRFPHSNAMGRLSFPETLGKFFEQTRGTTRTIRP
jgi:hypothetical protein